MQLAKRIVGMIVMGGRHHHRWVLVKGQAGTGKSTWVKVPEWLMGRDGFLSTDAAQVAGGFGLDGLQGVQLLTIKEVTDLEGREGGEVAGVAKRLMGEDLVTINAKFERPEKNVAAGAAVVMVSNVMPELPNEGAGLSQKMLVLPFETVFRGEEGEDLRLEEKLRAELEGVSWWALEGAQEVEREGAKKRWPVPMAALEVMREFRLKNNAADAFLEARCIRGEGGFVSQELLWREWEEWRRGVGMRLEVPRNGLATFLCQKGSWGLVKYRKAGGGPRGLKGLSLAKVVDDGTA